MIIPLDALIERLVKTGESRHGLDYLYLVDVPEMGAALFASNNKAMALVAVTGAESDTRGSVAPEAVVVARAAAEVALDDSHGDGPCVVALMSRDDGVYASAARGAPRFGRGDSKGPPANAMAIVEDARANGHLEVHLNPRLLLNLALAMGAGDGVGLKFSRDGNGKILVEPIGAMEGHAVGVLMPIPSIAKRDQP